MVTMSYMGSSHTLDGFNGIEVSPVKDDGTFCEVCEPHEASFWSVYGHWRTGGVECLWDCPTQKDAEDLADQAQAMLQEAGILEYDWRTGKEIVR